jgi:hypothetical protein
MHGKEKLHLILPSNLAIPSKPLTSKSQDVVGHNQMLTIQLASILLFPYVVGHNHMP